MYVGNNRVKLLPEAVALIEKYRDDTRGTLFPVIPYQALKWCLTSIKMKAGIKGRLSYHMGRHSFSTLMTLENGVPIETVSKMLGHADIRTTQVYARVTPKKLFEDMDKLMARRRENGASSNLESPFRGRPLPRRPWKLVQTSLKVKKSGDRPFRAESSSFGAYSARKLFPFHVCTMDAVGSGNKRPTEKSEQKTKEKQHTVSRILPVRMLFRYPIGGIFF